MWVLNVALSTSTGCPKMPRVWVVEYKSMWGLRVRVIMPTHCTSVEEFWVSFKIYPQVKYFQQVAWSGLKYSRIWQFIIAIYKKKALFLLLSLDFIFPTYFCKMSLIGIKNLFRFDTVINHHSSKFVRVILKIETLISSIEVRTETFHQFLPSGYWWDIRR